MQRFYYTVRDDFGRPVAGASVAVYQAGTSTLAAIYAYTGNETSTVAQANPITTGADGFFGFAAADGSYDILITGPGIVSRTLPWVNLFDGPGGGPVQTFNGRNGNVTLTSSDVTTALGFTPPNDALLVHLAGIETITGAKTFTASPVLPTPTNGDNSTKGATTAYVDNIGTAVGDTIYWSAAGTRARLAGNTTMTRQWLLSAGTGSAANAPAWAALTASDVNTALTYTAANDALVVHLAGTETITGAKTFNATITAAGITCTSLTNSALTSGRVTFAGTSGVLQDNANLTYTVGTGFKISDTTATTSSTNAALVNLGGYAGGNSMALFPTYSGSGTALYSYGIRNSGNTDTLRFGYADNSYHTNGGALLWLPDGAPFIYSPATFYLGTGSGANNYVSFSSTGIVAAGATHTFGPGSGAVAVQFSGAGASNVYLALQDAGVDRWRLNKDNAGAFQLASYNASGVFINNVFNVGNASTSAFSMGRRINMLAATTSTASANIAAGTAPTSPNEGDIWNDSTQKANISYVDAIKQTLEGVIFTATADASVTNTTTETTILGTGIGTKTLPANFFVAGKTIRIRIRGYIGDTLTPNLTVKAYYGGTAVFNSGAVALVALTGNNQFKCEVLITCRTTGATGTVYAQADFDYFNGTAPLALAGPNTATTTIDTTASSALDVKITWGTANASNTITATNATIEIIN